MNYQEFGSTTEVRIPKASKFLGVLVALISGLVGVTGAAHAEEEPAFEVVHRAEGFEIRQYAPYLVAETTISGGQRETSIKGFRILAGYIFGDNSSSLRMDMTVPVTTRKKQGERMKMTVPVTTTKTKDNSYTMRFVMESKYTTKTLPKPNDARVAIKSLPARTIAVLSYSGKTTEANFDTNRDALLKLLTKSGIKTISKPVSAVFDGPWTPAMMRRNEVQVEVAWSAKPPSASLSAKH